MSHDEAAKDEQERPQSLFGATAGAAAPSPPRRRAPLWKAAVVALVVAAAVAVFAAKSRTGPPPAADAQPASGQEPEGGRETVLATVNGADITRGQLDDALAELPPEVRSAYERTKHEFLEELVALELVVQQARGASRDPAGGAERPSSPDSTDGGRLMRDFLEKEVLSGVQVTEADLQSFYEEHRDELPGEVTFEQAKDSLRPYVERHKQQEAVQAYLDDLRSRADITRNEAWIEGQKALAADNPLDRALQTGRPVLADFGRGLCIPCKMMKPILDDLKEEYAGRAEILIIEVDEYPAAAQRVGIRAIPTQIFYDAEGSEVYRHEGFMPREDIVARLAEMGVK